MTEVPSFTVSERTDGWWEVRSPWGVPMFVSPTKDEGIRIGQFIVMGFELGWMRGQEALLDEARANLKVAYPKSSLQEGAS